jgi:hypothetical protein
MRNTIETLPFRRAEDFARRALERARVGVALFTRLQWLETVGRYNRLFKDHPPTLIAIYAERVPSHMGRWEPKGSTATGYCWLIWIKGGAPQAPFWIPPGQRKLCARPDDVARFTAHPVVKRDHYLRPIECPRAQHSLQRGGYGS